MKLLTLQLKNFKGIKSFGFTTSGGNVDIYGDNGTGKTTLFDALCWLLYDKDSQNKKDFGIKTLDADNKEIHNLEHAVEGVFDVGGIVTLRKVYTEKWTRKKGSAAGVFSGHTTEYFVDGVPVSKKEYEGSIAQIASEEVFKMVTNPSYFCETLHWQKRRELLLQICGDVTDADVIASDKALAKLPEILNGRSLDDHRKVLASRKTKINETLKTIPDRIDEVRRGLPDVSILDKEGLTTEIEALRVQRQDKEQELSRIQTGGEVAVLKQVLTKIETQLLTIANKHRQATSDKAFEKQKEAQMLKLHMSEIDNEIKSKAQNVELNANKIKQINDECQELRELYNTEAAEELEYTLNNTCPTCKQALPVAQVKEAREMALKQFNLAKSEKLEAINTKGKGLVVKITDLQELSKNIQKDIENLLNDKFSLNMTASELETEIEELNKVPDVSSNPEYAKLVQEKADVQTKITALDTEKQGLVESVTAEIVKLNGDIMTREVSLALFDQYEKGIKRVAELEEQEKTLAAEFETLEGELFLADAFTRAKVAMLTERINGRFRMAKFKLFDLQINGGLSECCEVLLNGVPYGAGLNTGHRIIIGMDVIRTLSEHFGFIAPIFVDNAESVTTLPDMDTQVIRLVKPEITDENREYYSQLVVEVDG